MPTLFHLPLSPFCRKVRLVAGEKSIGVSLEIEEPWRRREEFLALNPAAEVPVWVDDDGGTVADSLAICEYLDEIATAGPSLIGDTATQRAETRMWTRRIDLYIAEPLANGYRFAEGLAMFQTRLHCIPQAADDLKAIAQEKLAWLDGQLGDGREFVCGNRLTLADFLLFGFLEFGARVGQPLNPALARIGAHFGRMQARPCAQA